MTEHPAHDLADDVADRPCVGFAVSQIHTAATEESRRYRIAIAHTEGLITDQEAAEWLAAREAAE